MKKEIFRNRISGSEVAVEQVAYLEVDEYRFDGEEPCLVTVETHEGGKVTESSTFLISQLESILAAAKSAAKEEVN